MRLPAAILAMTLACSEGPGELPPPQSAQEPGRPLHGDHLPHHGGVVWMQSDDLHFEVVLDPAGEHRVYFSDAVRIELPAAVASDVTLRIRRSKGEPEETIALEIDEYGESWIGRGEPVENNPNAVAVVRFVHQGGTYELEMPFHVRPMDSTAPEDPHVVRP